MEAALAAYYAYAYSRHKYGILLWGNSTVVLQNKCIGTDTCQYRNSESCQSHFTILRILSITSIYIFANLQENILNFIQN